MNSFIQRHTKSFVITIFVLGVFRIGLFSASFPFFNNIDEHAHVDLVIKYSQGKLPGIDPPYMELESSRLFVLYGSPEYLYPPMPEALPFWKELEMNKNVQGIINAKVQRHIQAYNHEFSSPPLYYAVWGLWYKFGRLIDIQEKFILYWLKILNILVYSGVLIVAYLLARHFNQENVQFHLSVMLLLAVFPQDVFYAINNDVLSALLVPLAWLMLIKIAEDSLSRIYVWFTGIIISAAVLNKLTNLPALVFYAITVMWLLYKWRAKYTFHRRRQLIIELTVFSLVPILLWCTYNYLVLGDALGTEAKLAYLSWQKKVVIEWFNHPIFTLAGFKIFVSELIHTFWRGEFVWHQKHMFSPTMDLIYRASTIFFVPLGLLGCVFSRKTQANRGLCLSSGLIVLGYLVFMVLLSVMYTYENSYYPSTDFPYLTSGRILAGVIIPFAMLFVHGIYVFLKTIKLDRYLFSAISCFCLSVLINEIALSWSVFQSKHNFLFMLYS